MRRLLSILIVAAATAAVFVPGAVAGSGTLIVNGNWRCVRAVDYDVVRVTSSGNGDGVQLSTGCTGRIGRLEVTGVVNGDGIKVQNASTNAAHDLVIENGIVSCSGPPTRSSVHQDGVQAMGGRNITFRNLVIDCYGGGGGNWFVNRGGGGATTPTNIVCEHCAMGPHHSNQVNGATSVSSGVRDSLLCTPRLGRVWRGNQSVNAGNTIVPASDPRCANVETLEAWITDTRPGPEPEPEPEPEPPVICDEACVAAYEEEIADLQAELDAAGANEGLLLAEIARLEAILAEIAELATV